MDGRMRSRGNMKAIERELKKIEKRESHMRLCAEKASVPAWKIQLEDKVPEKVLDGLQKAFSKAFYLIFEKGAVVIEKTYDKESLEKDFLVRDYAIDLKGGRKEIGRLKKEAAGSHALAALGTAFEGIGLGVLGIGMPDIVVWLGILLRGIYETALKYGYDYEMPEEKLFILKMMETAMLAGDAWILANQEADDYICKDIHVIPTDEELKGQINKTASAFATDMLVMKFIQGLPVVGIIGGASNPVYYRKVMNYVELKYRKRYLLSKD